MGLMPLHTRSVVVALFATFAATACSPATGGAARTGPQPAISASRPHTAADIHFMSMMIGHHTQAIEMARLAPTRAASSAVRTLAERIINTQQDEIATLQQWLRDRRQPVPEAHAMGAHAGHGGHGTPDVDARYAQRGPDEAAGAGTHGSRVRPAVPELHDPAPPAAA